MQNKSIDKINFCRIWHINLEKSLDSAKLRTPYPCHSWICLSFNFFPKDTIFYLHSATKKEKEWDKQQWHISSDEKLISIENTTSIWVPDTERENIPNIVSYKLPFHKQLFSCNTKEPHETQKNLERPLVVQMTWSLITQSTNLNIHTTCSPPTSGRC